MSENEQTIRDQVAAIVADESAPAVATDDKAIDFRFVRQCLEANERGDGVLYASMHRETFVFNKTTGGWLEFTGQHWVLDKWDFSHAAVEDVALKYLEMSESLVEPLREARKEKAAADEKFNQANADDNSSARRTAEIAIDKAEKEIKSIQNIQKQFIERAKRLRSTRGVKNCLEFSHKIQTPLAIKGDELDKKPMLLACKNGVIDLRTGKLLPGKPTDYLLRSIDVEYLGTEADREAWEKFMLQIHQDDPELLAFVQRMLGYAITGLTREHFIACFVGEGRNGKGTMFETLTNILGELAWTIQPEMILEQKNAKSSAGPSADMIALMGRRIVIASETDEHRRIAGSKVKYLTGGDTINARAPHDKYETNFQPTHTLFLQTNNIPQGLTKDYALLKRLLFLQYPLKFIDEPDPNNPNERKSDPDLKEKFLKIRPGILGWLVEGCLLYQRDGLKPPASVKADIEELRKSEDVVGQWLEDRAVELEPTNRILLNTLYKNFENWYEEERDEKKTYILKKIGFGKDLIKKGFEKKKQSGDVWVFGIGLKSEDGRQESL